MHNKTIISLEKNILIQEIINDYKWKKRYIIELELDIFSRNISSNK